MTASTNSARIISTEPGLAAVCKNSDQKQAGPYKHGGRW